MPTSTMPLGVSNEASGARDHRFCKKNVVGCNRNKQMNENGMAKCFLYYYQAQSNPSLSWAGWS